MPATDPSSGGDNGTDAGHSSAATDLTTNAHPAHHDSRELATLVDDSGNTTRHTICPARADATELLTTWLTVDETVICNLENWR
jgi:hypothetical protein